MGQTSADMGRLIDGDPVLVARVLVRRFKTRRYALPLAGFFRSLCLRYLRPPLAGEPNSFAVTGWFLETILAAGGICASVLLRGFHDGRVLVYGLGFLALL